MSQADLELLITPGSAGSYGLTLRFRYAAAGQDRSWSGAWTLDAAALLARELDPAAYGEALAAQLFAQPAVRAFLDQALAVAASHETPLHLRLFLTPEVEALHSLRWETLRLPGSPAPLATSERVRFSRYLDSKDWRPVQALERDDLRALVVVASPDVAGTTLAEVRTEEEVRAARAGLGEIPSVTLATRGQATLANLMASLRDGYDILYLVAHGMIVDGEPYILLEQADGGRAWTSGRELAAQLGELAQPPGLAVLVSCQSAGSGQQDGGALAALGPRLAAAGVPAVVAMQGNVRMDTAAAFMPAFLRELRRDGQVDRAVSVARGSVRERFDWYMPVLFSRLEDGRLFRLPQAADDPLADLPGLPPLDLPDKPYRYLDWYRRADAQVFFGRGREIRALYERVTAPDGEPIVLLYGQSGVGKSSLLAAGMLPRLEESHAIRYARRDQGQGLLGTLGAALGAPTDADLAMAWRDLEAQAGKPLLAVLDQVEEVWTRPNPEQSGELGEFLAALAGLFGDLARRPQGRLLLGFRKEWLAEINQRLAEHSLPRGEVFLERLGRAGIAEVVAGPQSRPRLRARYGLAVSDALPNLIADDLLADRGSPVAPMLAILLAGMWEAAKAKSYDRPVFDEELYHEFRGRGLSLDDFLGRQLQTLHDQLPVVVDSGLALDVLAYHTTPLGTAEQRTLADLTETYRHRQDALPALVQACRDLYLLVDPSENQPDQPPASRLTHDTLAPHVRRRFDESDAPGQRARRILESRVSAKEDGALSDDGQSPAPLGDADLAVVLAGRDGMRAWRGQEERLVAISEAASHAQARVRKRNQLLAVMAVLAIVGLILGVLVVNSRGQQERLAIQGAAATRQAEDAQELAMRATVVATAVVAAQANEARAVAFAADAQAAQASAEAQARRARAGELAVQVQVELAKPIFDPSLALLLAQQAIQSTWPEDGYVSVNADRALLDAIAKAPSWQITLPGRGHASSVHLAAYSPDGSRIVTAGGDGTARIWDAATGEAVRVLSGHSGPVYSAAYGLDGSQIVTAGEDGTARIWDAATGEEVRTLSGHGSPVHSAAYSPDGSQIVTAGEDGTTRIWDAATGEEVRTLSGHGGPVYSAAYSPDGSQIVTAGKDWTVRIWDARTVEELRTLSGHGGPVYSAAYSPDGSQIVTAGEDWMVHIWDAATGQEVRTLSGNGHSPAYSPDGSQIVAANGGTARIWDVATGVELRTLSGHRDGSVHSAAYSPDGSRIVTAGEDGTVRIWDVATGEGVRTLSDLVYSVAYSPDGSQIVTAGEDGTVDIWDVRTGEAVRTLGGHSGPVWSAAYSPDGGQIVTASWDGTARVWDAATGEALRTLSGHSDHVWSAAYSPDGSQIVTASGDGTVRIWDAATGEEVRTLSGHSGVVYSAAFSPECESSPRAPAEGCGSQIVTAGGDGTARIWDAATGEAVLTLSGHSDYVWSAAYSPDGSQIVTAGGDGTARIWHAATGVELRTLSGHSDWVRSAAYSPDGSRIVTAGRDGKARIWDTATGQELRTLSGHGGPVYSAAYSPDGSQIVTASSDRTVRIWNARMVEDLRTLSGHGDPVYSAAYSPDGSQIVTIGGDRTVRIWDARTVEELRTLSGHSGHVWSAAYSPDGSQIVTASGDGTVRIWDAATGEELRTLSGHSDWGRSAAYSPDGSRIVTAVGGATRVWDAATGKEVLTLRYDSRGVHSAAYSPDGSRIVTASGDGTAHIWDAATGVELCVLSGHGGPVYSAAYSPECESPPGAPAERCGSQIVTIGGDGTAHVWDAATCVELRTLSGHGGAFSAAYSPDGYQIVTASDDGTVRIWDARTGQAVRSLSGHLGRVYSAAYSPDGRQIITTSDDGTARIWIASIDDLLAEAARLIQRDPPLLTPEERQRYGLD